MTKKHRQILPGVWYLYIYYKSIGETDTPEYLQLEIEIAFTAECHRMRIPKSVRATSDLLRLGWSYP